MNIPLGGIFHCKTAICCSWNSNSATNFASFSDANDGGLIVLYSSGNYSFPEGIKAYNLEFPFLHDNTHSLCFEASVLMQPGLILKKTKVEVIPEFEQNSLMRIKNLERKGTMKIIYVEVIGIGFDPNH